MELRVNAQPPEPRDRTMGSLEVVSVWDTIQGEGPYAGVPATFVRLAGCNIQCRGCDTDYTSNRRRVGFGDLLTEVLTARKGYERGNRSVNGSHLVVLTGGEPFRQELGEFIRILLREGIAVQIETNGTVFPDRENSWYLMSGLVTVVCSPKTPQLSEHLTSSKYVKALKYVLRAGAVDPKDGLPTETLGRHHTVARPWVGYTGEVYVQPEDQGDEALNTANVAAAVESVRKFGYRLCLQLHKIIGVE